MWLSSRLTSLQNAHGVGRYDTTIVPLALPYQQVEGMLPAHVEVLPGANAVVRVEPTPVWVVDLGEPLTGCTVRAQLGGRDRVAGPPAFEARIEGTAVVLPYRADSVRLVGRCEDGGFVAAVLEDDEVHLASRRRGSEPASPR